MTNLYTAYGIYAQTRLTWTGTTCDNPTEKRRLLEEANNYLRDWDRARLKEGY